MSARLKAGHDHQRKTCLQPFGQRHIFACQTYPAHAAAGRGWFVRTRTPDWPNMLPLYDFKHPRSHPKRGGHESHDKIHPRMDTGDTNPIKGRCTTQGKWWSLSGSNRRPEACKATALPAELRPLGEAKVWFWPQTPAGTSVPLAAPRISANARPGLRRSRVRPAVTFLRRSTGRRRRFAGPHDKMVGLGRLERPTSPLSGVRSNHLSYRPEPHPKPPVKSSPDRCIRRRKRNEDGSVPHHEL